ncbi:MAG: hypothetical protein ACUVR8_06550 [Acidobacteriota bacterium]
MSILERFWRWLVLPIPSRAVCALTAEGVVTFDRRTWRSNVQPWPEQAFQPAFDTENIHQATVFASTLLQSARALGIAKEHRWSVLLPGATARAYVVTIEITIPPQDIPDVLVWKAERLTGLPKEDIWMTTAELGQGITAAGTVGRRFLLLAMSRRVALSLHANLAQLSWQPGLLLPRLVGESLWLQRAGASLNQMLISVEDDTLAVMLLQRGIPLSIRTLPLAGELPDEQLLRLLLFFREHAVESGLSADAQEIQFEVLPVDVPLEVTDISQCIRETFGAQPHVIEPQQLGFGSSAEFSRLAGITGLALATD